MQVLCHAPFVSKAEALDQEEAIMNMGQTSASQQRKYMEKRVNTFSHFRFLRNRCVHTCIIFSNYLFCCKLQAAILNRRHGQHIVILSFSKHGKGYTTYKFGTKGPGAKFITENENGKPAERLFDNFMRSRYYLTDYLLNQCRWILSVLNPARPSRNLEMCILVL